MFIDKVTVQCFAGKGGNGIVSWRREKYVPKGGPNGGNGGKGGDIVLESDKQVLSLEKFRNKSIIKAENGQCGGPSRQQGKGGKDLILKVPCGTVVKNAKSGEVLFDFTSDNQSFVFCKGGKGGRGNASFKTPTNRAPNYCTEGRNGEVWLVELELKLIADVGLVGFPNAGKSTLISALTYAMVKIAPYPFTTLYPNLGYVLFDDYSKVLIADIPGIIEGAHKNKGLGFQFLRHIERTSVITYVLDASGIDGRNPYDDFLTLREEIGKYNPQMLKRPYLVVLNKIDIDSNKIEEFYSKYSLDKSFVFNISALYGNGIQEFKEKMKNLAQIDGKKF